MRVPLLSATATLAIAFAATAVGDTTDPYAGVRKEFQEAFANAEATKGKPTCIVANTVKGKGVSFMENNPKYHGVAPTQHEMELALQEIG